MSFIYANKEELKFGDEVIKQLHICSDTKATFGNNYSNWTEKTKKAIDIWGIVKTLIITPKCCISFAGNNIIHVHKLLSWVDDQGTVSVDEMCEKAYEIHEAAPDNDIEFIVCHIDSQNEHHITCIKNKKIEFDCVNAWIGSQETFLLMQEYRMKSFQDNLNVNDTASLFRKAVKGTNDTTVGGLFLIDVRTSLKNEFVYSEKLESVYDLPQTIQPGNPIVLFGSVSEGGYTVNYREGQEEVIIDIQQADLTVYFTKEYRLTEFDANNHNSKYFLLPILYRTSTGKVLL